MTKSLLPLAASSSPFLYLFAIISIGLSSFQNSRSFHEQSNGLELSGARFEDSSILSGDLKNLTLKTTGAFFSYSWLNQPILTTEDNITRHLALSGYTATPAGFTLNFSHQVQIIVSKDNGMLQIEPVIPKTLPPVTAFEVPWPVKTAEFWNLAADEEPALKLSGTRLAALYDKDAIEFNAAKQRIVFKIYEEKAPVLVFAESQPETAVKTATQWLEQNTGKQSAGNLERRIADYLNESAAGYLARFNRKSGAWRQADGSEAFSEQTLVASLAQNLGGAAYTEALEQAQAAARQHTNQLTFLSAAYLGGLPQYGEQLRLSFRKTGADIAAALQNGHSQIFQRDGLFNFLINHNMGASRLPLASLALMQNENEPLLTAAGKILFLVDCIRDEARSNEIEAIENQLQSLLQKIVWTRNGLYFQEQNSLNLAAGLRIGQAFIAASQTSSLSSSASQYKAIGLALQAGALQFKQKDGFVPTAVLADSGKPAAGSQFIAPEKLYTMLNNWQIYTPQEFSQHKTMNAGQYIFASANSARGVFLNNRAIQLSLERPSGFMHSFFFSGLYAVAKVSSGSKNLEKKDQLSFSEEGWVFDQTNRVLYVQIAQEAPKQNVRIDFAEPPVEATTSQLSTPGAQSSPKKVQEQAPPAEKLTAREKRALEKEAEKRQKQEEKRKKEAEKRQKQEEKRKKEAEKRQKNSKKQQ